VLADSHRQRYPGEIRRAEDLLKFMRAEYIEILEEIAGASVADEISFRTLQEKIKQPTLPNTANTLKSNENESLMLPAPDVHVSTNILNQFLDMLEGQQTPHLRCCEQCNLSFANGKSTQNERVEKGNVFQIPSIEAITNYIGHTPTSLQNDPIFKKHFGDYTRNQEDADLVLECHWPDNIVQICVVLLYHAFHCPTVQCGFISDYQLGKVKKMT
jgi:hypothetical protein